MYLLPCVKGALLGVIFNLTESYTLFSKACLVYSITSFAFSIASILYVILQQLKFLLYFLWSLFQIYWVPVGAGVALANQYLGNGGICVALYGDGAANQGQIFEAYNISKLWNLPAVFVCENNGYGMGTSVDRASASVNYYTRGDYIPGIWVDGMDVLSVREALRYCQDYCTKNGPLVLEIATYRYSGHSMSDPGTSYRTREEIQEVRQTRDPIMLWREKIVQASLATAEELKKIDGEVRKEVDEAVKVSKSDKEVPLQELAADVYYEPLETEIRGTTPFRPYKHQRLAQPFNAH
ncbi:hypothetical protein HAZT_HAZT006471 [Hyalella azteca]|uniref:Dehydrogenase E1 component domain-containing protein n=1 Tax=Hyalella azteca TaxID=294128 RepID=A0A6A0H9A6_HYAAZ|nr:hypothetical protein HAZT_HAZT006471 [Hyalella azteca]